VNHLNVLLVVSTLTLAVAGAGIVVSCSDQPAARCQAGRGGWAAKYIQTSGPDAGGCVVPGEALIIETYNPPPAQLSPASVAIGWPSIATAVGQSSPDPNTAHTPYAFGPFATTYPGSDGFCNVPTLTVAEQDVPAVPPMPPPADAGPEAAGTPAIPATTIRYAWDHVRVYATTTAQGTELVGELTYAVDNCTATYHVQALYPKVPCALLDDAGTPVGPDPTACDPYANPNAGRATGSGILPDVKVVCDPALLLCVLAGDPPSLR
jgi:hypothetical protein